MCSDVVGMAGFEPAASCSQSRRANQAAPHPADRSVAYRPECYRLVWSSSRARNARSSSLNGLTVAWHIISALGPLGGYAVGAYLAGIWSHAGRAGVAQWQSPSLPSWS
jgi:hypothetical protein